MSSRAAAALAALVGLAHVERLCADDEGDAADANAARDDAGAIVVEAGSAVVDAGSAVVVDAGATCRTRVTYGGAWIHRAIVDDLLDVDASSNHGST